MADSAEALKGYGAKLKEVQYVQGKAYVVNLSGVAISDDIVKRLKELGTVTELDMSKSTVTDDQLGAMVANNMFTFLLRFDLSNTGITDAGLEKLDNLLVLNELNLTGSKVTKAAADRWAQKRKSQTHNLSKNPKIKI